jgi:hypothetical protein
MISQSTHLGFVEVSCLRNDLQDFVHHVLRNCMVVLMTAHVTSCIAPCSTSTELCMQQEPPEQTHERSMPLTKPFCCTLPPCLQDSMHHVLRKCMVVLMTAQFLSSMHHPLITCAAVRLFVAELHAPRAAQLHGGADDGA